ncbi:MAG: potassium channel protein [Microcystis aeruginosa Ma_MB_S_20031200_S102]|uniref:Potassium channel protein n=1 Tax=Microcystis aeruginosa Ma_MB_S_20031200_S102 TaxID=2486254 RepID=A0A552F291_MICAE|nr:MAG: potassium channel protein [Microcystis aeruginosa Ma_MB_S_20031200_S102D]TRU40840.1 MAG: potassium channel protein [Microcystis aeruginosa Ma_MB_S_20031200_S102]
MQSSLKRIIIGASFFLATVVGATIGYMAYGWSFLDAVYMVIITIFGVGFGEVKPINTPSLRAFTMLVIICGTTSAVYVVGGFFQMLTEGEINKAFSDRRMNKEMESLENHVIICGFGRIGRILTTKLAKTAQSFIIVDNNPDRIRLAQEKGYITLNGNATDESILQKAGIDKARVLATVLPDDALNVFITLTARELSPQLYIIARGEYPSTEKKLKLAGADQVVLPATIGAERMAHLITHPAAIDFLQEDEGRRNLNELLADIDLQFEEYSILSDSPFLAQPISQMEVRGQGAFIIVAIRQFDGRVITHPDNSTILQQGDTVILLGHRGDVPNFARRYALRREMRYRGSSW